MKKHLILLLTLGICIRFYQLDTSPPGMSHDELDFVNNGYSLVRTGRDLYGDPLHLTVGRRGIVVIPALLSGVFTGIFGLNQYWAKFPAAIMGIMDVILVYIISKSLFRSRTAALWSGLALALSPWGMLLSRSMYDPPVSLFFFLLALALVVRAKTSRRLLLVLVILNLGLWSYYGALFFYLPVFFLFVYWQRKLLNIPVIFLVAALLSAGLLIYYAGTRPATGRSKELLIQKLPDIEAQVVFDRSYSPSPPLVNRIFINKATVFATRLAAGYLEVFNPRVIFIDGDPNRQFGMWGRGELVFWELPLIVLGLYWAFLHYRRPAVFISLILLSAPLTTSLSAPVFATRSFLLYPALLLFSGLGFVKLISYSRKMIIIFLGLYLFSAVSGMHQYFFRYPIYAAAQWFDYEKALGKYLTDVRTPAVVLTPENRQMFYQYYFFARPNPRAVQSNLYLSTVVSPIHFGNLAFLSDCRTEVSKGELLIVHKDCYPDPTAAVQTIKTTDKSDRVFWYIFKP